MSAIFTINPISNNNSDTIYDQIEMVVSKLNDHDDFIIEFNPPLIIEMYWYPKENFYYINFDFGLSLKYEKLPQPYYLTPSKEWYQILSQIVEFELDHSFFHISMDPNYSTLNYALFGCLCLNNRAINFSTKQPINSLP